MLGLLASTTACPTSVTGVLAGVPVPGEYFSVARIVVALIAFGILTRCMTWVDSDLSRVHGPRTLWNMVVLLAGLLASVILLFVPHFPVALMLFAAAGAAGLGSYVLWRNSVVGEEDRVLTWGHLSKLISGSSHKGPKNQLMPDLDITIQRTDGAKVIVEADDEVLQTGFRLAHFLLADALEQRATDVALLPVGQATRLLYRVDGVTSERQRLTVQDTAALLEFMKYAGKMKREEKRLPQKGRLAIRSTGGTTEIWLSTSGSSAGERLDIKVISEAMELTIDELRLPADQLAQMRSLAESQKGLVILSGGRDCGITTTMHAFLLSHDPYVQHIHSIEARPLAELENVTLHKPKVVGGKVDMPGTLRTVLRGDPGVVMVEPAKDAETMKMMLKAGQSRKLYGGLPQSNTFSALTEIMTLAGDPDLVAGSLRGIVAQKLMRKLCPTCREAYQPDPGLLKRLNLSADRIKQFYRPPSKPLVDQKGKPIICPTCKGSGYFGRVGAFEVLVVNDTVRELIRQDAALSQIKSACRKGRMLYLQEQALRRVIEGLTSVNEVVRISKK